MPRIERRTVGALALVAVLVLAGCSGAGNPVSGGASLGGGGDAGSARTAGGEAAGGSYYENGTRVIIREARMDIEVQNHDPAFDRAREIARAHGGFVADWTHSTERDWDRTRLVIRVPAGNFSAIRDDLATLGYVESETVQARDFTIQYQTAGARLEDLRAEERTFERLLNRTDDPEEARRIQEDLHRIREQMRELQRERARLERQEALSTIRLTIEEPASKKPPKNYETAFGFEDAFLESFFGGLTALKYVIVVFGYLIPVSVAGLLAGLFLWSLTRVGLLAKSRVEAIIPGSNGGSGDGGGGSDGDRANGDADGDSGADGVDGDGDGANDDAGDGTDDSTEGTRTGGSDLDE